MPVIFEIDVERALVTTTVTGSVSPAEMFAYQQALVADPRFSAAFDSLTDFSAAEPFSGTPAEIRQLVNKLPCNAGTKRAYVASIDQHYGLSRMAQVYAESNGIVAEVFRDQASALRWLGRGSAHPDNRADQP